MDSQVEWRDTDLQHHGQHTVDELNYIMESKPEKGLYIYFHDEEPRTHAELLRGYRDLLMKTNFEQDTDLLDRSEIDCDHTRLAPLGLWTSAVPTASKACRNVRTQRQEGITRATGLVEEGDGESVEVSVQDTLKGSSPRLGVSLFMPRVFECDVQNWICVGIRVWCFLDVR